MKDKNKKLVRMIKRTLHLLKGATIGFTYYMLITRVVGSNDDGCQEYIFHSLEDVEDYAMWLTCTNRTYKPIEVIKFRSHKVLSGRRPSMR